MKSESWLTQFRRTIVAEGALRSLDPENEALLEQRVPSQSLGFSFWPHAKSTKMIAWVMNAVRASFNV